jgi:capsule polysaccharide export protein KpsE/RkpR
MEMEFVGVLKVMWRWLWLIVLIVGTTCVLLYMNPNFSVVDYRAEVILLFTTPDREDVSAFDDYVFTSERDEVTIAINKFIEIAQFPEVMRRTLEELNLQDVQYDVVISAELGADFIYLTVAADTPELAAQIANAHAANAIEFFGELRTMPANQALTFFADEIVLAEQALTDAETALSNFQTEHEVVSIEDELDLEYEVLTELEVWRAQMLVYQVTAGRVNSIDNPEGMLVTVTETDIANVDALIEQQRDVIANLNSLQGEYDTLVSDVDAAREHLDYLKGLQIDVQTRESFAAQAMFIQVMQEALPPTSAEDTTVRTFALGALGSLGFAILLVFFLDYITKRW